MVSWKNMMARDAVVFLWPRAKQKALAMTLSEIEPQASPMLGYPTFTKVV